MKVHWLMGMCVVVLAACTVSAQAVSEPLPTVEGPVCVASGKWKGTQKTPVVTSSDGRQRMYGWLEWDRPQKWTGKRCEANWWVFASLDGDKFKPIVARQDFLEEGQQPSLAVAALSANARWAAADVMTTTSGVTRHGYFIADLAEHTSCFGSAVRGLDGVREELTLDREPWRQQLLSVRDDGWLQLSVHARATASEAENGVTRSGRSPFFDPCSGKLKVEATR